MKCSYAATALVLAGAFLVAPRAAQIIVVPSTSLQVFQNPSGQVIAYASGHVPSCGITPDDSEPVFHIDGTTITVTQGAIAVTCTNPPPADKYYQGTINFGRLFDGTYTINWNLPALGATYSVAGNPGIGAAFTGNWFNPAQSGHGFEIEVLATQPPQLFVFWFVFAPGGGPTWIGGTGAINGNQAVVDAYQVSGSGALFPPRFNPAAVQSEPWGKLTFKFADCNSGQVSWSSTVPGYGSGTLPLSRLTLPAGLSCP